MRPVVRGMLSSSAVRIGVVGALALAGVGSLAAMRAAPAVKAGGSGSCSTSITKQNFGTANSGPYGGNQTVWRYTLTNANCMQVRIITYGATVQSIAVPDRMATWPTLRSASGPLRSTSSWTARRRPRRTLAVPTSARPSAGTPTGSPGASFKLNGKTYTLPINNGPNTLHGGFVGWGNRIWQHPTTATAPGRVSLSMTLVRPNGDEGAPSSSPAVSCTGFPAKLTTSITYSLDNAQPPVDPLPVAQQQRKAGDGYST